VHALEGVSLEFYSAGISAIIGPNGAGKTTLLNVITGFLKPDAGQCFLHDREVTRLPPHRIARLGIARTFQDLRLVRQITVLDNVMLACPRQQDERLLRGLLHWGVAREEARNREEAVRLLEDVGLKHEAERLAGEMSYGQQKLLTFACCLATKAQIIILDEPVAGVHPEMISHILDLMLRLRNDGKQVIFTEHDISAVRRVADEIVVMYGGRKIAQGAPREVLESPQIIEVYLA